MFAIPFVLAEPHDPIFIRGDSGFTWPLNGVTGGSGTLEDPYIIEGWEIQTGPNDFDTGIHFYDTTAHVVVRDVHITGTVGVMDYALMGQESSNIRIEGVTTENIRHGMKAYKGHNIVVRDSTLAGAYESEGGETLTNGEYGVHMWDVSEVTISNNRITGFQNGISTTQGTISHNTVVADFGISQSGEGTIFQNDVTADAGIGATSPGVIIKENVVRGEGHYGIYLGTQGPSITGGIIQGNTVHDKHIGIIVDNAHEAQVRGNDVFSSTYMGIQVQSSRDVVIKKNLIADGVAHHQIGAITCENCMGFNISQNEVLRNDSSGIQLAESGKGTVWNNSILDNGSDMWLQYGILIEGNENVISFNTIERMQGTAIYVENGAGNIIHSNGFDGNEANTEVGMDAKDTQFPRKETPLPLPAIPLLALAFWRRP